MRTDVAGKSYEDYRMMTNALSYRIPMVRWSRGMCAHVVTTLGAYRRQAEL